MGKKKITNSHDKQAHTELYNYLVKKNIIEEKGEALNLFATGHRVYLVNRNLTSPEKLKDLLKKEDNDFPKLLMCYNINYIILSNFLINYEYKATDEFTVLMGGKKLRKTKRAKKQRKTSKKRKTM